MKFIRLEIPEIILIEPALREDPRGFFYESYRQDLFRAHGIDVSVVQDNHSCSARGVLRGMHYQITPKAQAKLVRVIRGEVFDTVIDIRKKSPTFGKYLSVKLDAERKQMLYVPAGFAHGILALQEGTEVLYKASEFYSPEYERGVLWSDPAIGIEWPKLDIPYQLSPKDQKYPLLKDADLF